MDKASALEFSVRFRKPFRFVDFDTKVLKRSFRKIGRKSRGWPRRTSVPEGFRRRTNSRG